MLVARLLAAAAAAAESCCCCWLVSNAGAPLWSALGVALLVVPLLALIPTLLPLTPLGLVLWWWAWSGRLWCLRGRPAAAAEADDCCVA